MRARIVAAAVASVGAVLAVAAVLLVAAVGSLLERPMRGEARARAAEVAFQFQASGTELASDRGPGADAAPPRLGPLAGPWPTLAQLVDDDGDVLAASAELVGLPPLLAVDPAERETHGETRLRYGGRDERFRLDAVVATVGGRRATVIVATSLGQVDQVTSALTRVLAVAVPPLVAVVAALAWVLVGRALHPVESLRREVAELAAAPARGPAHRPSAAAAAPRDEVGRLAGTLDELLGELARQRDTQRRFVADASHELRSPIANIRAALDVARLHPDSRPWPEVADEVYAQNERLAHLVDDLLVLARAEAGRLRGVRAPVELGHLAATVLDERRGARAEERPVRLVLDRLDEATVEGDESQLRRIVVNLIDNACRHARSEVGVAV
ncbi:MAG: HAMP domain-containing histidine kinase, partial [Acidimicrobiales bacterium]|nr:HAMP domain-containing histidine kinase [Acidimicrobiales bacterium]